MDVMLSDEAGCLPEQLFLEVVKCLELEVGFPYSSSCQEKLFGNSWMDLDRVIFVARSVDKSALCAPFCRLVGSRVEPIWIYQTVSRAFILGNSYSYTRIGIRYRGV